MFVGDESDLLDLGIHSGLKGAVESFRFRSQFGYVGDFRFDRNFELVGGIPRQSEAIALVGDEFDSHDELILLIVNDKGLCTQCM